MTTSTQRARVFGSNYTTFRYKGQSIAYLESVQDSGQTPVAQAQAIHPLGYSHPVEWVTARAINGGSIQVAIRELWRQEVWQQLAGLANTTDIVEVFAAVAAQQGTAGISCTKIITPPSGPKYGKTYHNCLDGSVEYLTKDGTKSLAETAGTLQMVLGSRGQWVPAQIEAFGDQETYLVTLSRRGRQKQVRATAGHRWFKQGRRKQRCYSTEVTTQHLQAGDVMVSTYRPRQTSLIRPSSVGIQAGIVFGDGNLEGRAQNVSGVSLWGDKDAQLLKWFPHSPTRSVVAESGLTGVRAVDLPRFFRDRPDLGEGASYLYGWLWGNHFRSWASLSPHSETPDTF